MAPCHPRFTAAPLRPLVELTRRRGVEAATATRRLVDGKRGLNPACRLLSERQGQETTRARSTGYLAHASRGEAHRTPEKRVGESHWRAITAKREEQIGCETFYAVLCKRNRVAISRLFSPSPLPRRRTEGLTATVFPAFPTFAKEGYL